MLSSTARMCIDSRSSAQLLHVAQWLERRTGIAGPEVRVLPEGLCLYFRNCSRFDSKIVYKISFCRLKINSHELNKSENKSLLYLFHCCFCPHRLINVSKSRRARWITSRKKYYATKPINGQTIFLLFCVFLLCSSLCSFVLNPL